MLHKDEMVRRLTEIAFDNNNEQLLGIVDRFEAADDDWNAKRTMVNKANAEKAYNSLRKAYQVLVQGV